MRWRLGGEDVLKFVNVGKQINQETKKTKNGAEPLALFHQFNQHQNSITNMITPATRFIVLLLVTTLLAIVSIGCNTAHGFGKDVTNTGNSIQKGTR